MRWQKKSLLEKAKQMLVGDTSDIVEDPYTSFVKLLSLNDCQFALYNAPSKQESKKEDLVFKFWGPESALYNTR